MRRLLSSAAILAGILTSTSAFAAYTPTGILNGAQLVWDGTATCLNQLYVGLGGIFVGAAPPPDATLGPQFITQGGGGACTVTNNFSFATDTGGAQVANKVYYVYGAYPGASIQWVISTSAPNQGGAPWRALTYTPSGGSQTTTSSAIFIGSYITDGTASHNMVPFLKKGDEVIFTPSVSTATELDQNTAYQASATFNPGGGYPLVSAITFTAATTPIPETASALLVDFIVANTSTTFLDARVLNPVLDGYFMGGGQCFTAPQYYLSSGANVTPVAFNHARIKTALNTGVSSWDGGLVNTAATSSLLNTIEVGVCQGPPNNSLEITAAYVGYVEVPHHLSY